MHVLLFWMHVSKCTAVQSSPRKTRLYQTCVKRSHLDVTDPRLETRATSNNYKLQTNNHKRQKMNSLFQVKVQNATVDRSLSLCVCSMGLYFSSDSTNNGRMECGSEVWLSAHSYNYEHFNAVYEVLQLMKHKNLLLKVSEGPPALISLKTKRFCTVAVLLRSPRPSGDQSDIRISSTVVTIFTEHNGL